jgi:hypothetical protein
MEKIQIQEVVLVLTDFRSSRPARLYRAGVVTNRRARRLRVERWQVDHRRTVDGREG